MAHNEDIENVLHKAVDVELVLSSLDFSDENVVEASKAQPFLFLEASRLRIQSMRASARAKSALEVAKAQAGSRFRRKNAEEGNKTTEGQVAEHLAKHSKLVALEQELDNAESLEEFSKLLLDAYKMRRDALKIVADLIGAEIFVAKMNTSAQAELKKAKQELQSKYPGKYGGKKKQ